MRGDSRCLWCACLVVSRRESHAHPASRWRRRRGQLLGVVSSRRFLSSGLRLKESGASISGWCQYIGMSDTCAHNEQNGCVVVRSESLENVMGCDVIARCGVVVLVAMPMTKSVALGDAQRRDGYAGIQLGLLEDPGKTTKATELITARVQTGSRENWSVAVARRRAHTNLGAFALVYTADLSRVAFLTRVSTRVTLPTFLWCGFQPHQHPRVAWWRRAPAALSSRSC